MNRIFFLGAVFAGLGFGALLAQEPTPEAKPRYRLFQVVESSTLQQSIEEAAGQGYRLITLANAPGDTIAAIMQISESPSTHYQYVFRDLKVRQKAAGDLSQQLSQFAAEGFHLHTILSSGPYISNLHPPDALVVMEKPPGTPSGATPVLIR